MYSSFTGVRLLVFTSIQFFPVLVLLVPCYLVLLEGLEGLGNLVPQGHAVALPLTVIRQPLGPARLLFPVGLNLLFVSGVLGEGILLGIGKILDLLDLLLAAPGGCPG